MLKSAILQKAELLATVSASAAYLISRIGAKVVSLNDNVVKFIHKATTYEMDAATPNFS